MPRPSAAAAGLGHGPRPEGNADFSESNINDLVYIIINPIISDFIRFQVGKQAGRERIVLRREKIIVSPDGETGGREEFVVVDRISVREEKVVLIMEARRPSLGIGVF